MLTQFAATQLMCVCLEMPRLSPQHTSRLRPVFLFQSKMLSVRRLLRTGAFSLKQLANFALARPDYLKEIFGQLNGLFLGVCLENRKAADNVFGLCERAVRHADLAIQEAHARSKPAWETTFGPE